MGFNLLDYIIMSILLLSGLIGYKRGFFASVAGILGTITGLGIAFLYQNQLAKYLQEHYELVTWLTTILEKRLPIPAWGAKQTGLLPSLPGVNEGLAFIHNQVTEFAYLIISALCFLILYVVSKQLLRIFATILTKIFNWGILGGINRLAGAGTVLMQNTIIIAALLGIISSPLGLGAKIGIKSVAQVMLFIQGSVLAPGLIKIFAWLHSIVVAAGV